MADEPTLATKAPESDAQEDAQEMPTSSDAQSSPAPATSPTAQQSLIPGDTPAQTGASMGEHCVTDRPLPPTLSSAQAQGELTTLNGIQCYVSKPPSYPSQPSKLLLLLSSGTGIHSPNNQHQADAFAARGYVVVMPDQFAGDAAPNAASTATPASPSAPEPSGPEAPGILERLKLGAVEAAKSFSIDMWLARHTPEKVLPIVNTALDGAKDAFADAAANGGGIYGVGYCFGAKYILLLCGRHPDTVRWGQKQPGADPEQGEVETGPALKAGSIAHGTLVTKADIEAVRSPVYIAAVEDDNLFPDDVREQGRAALELNAVENEIEVFQGVPHGFAVVGAYGEDVKIKQAQDKAFEKMASWLERF